MNSGYVGSSPYCFSNSLAMALGSKAPPVPAIEFLTGSPFGVHLLGGAVPLFSPYQWDPILGVDQALELLGWTATRSSGTDPCEAIDRLTHACRHGPVLAGPFEMGLLLHHPGSGTPILADHFVAVLEVTGDAVRFHDPHGFPHSQLPIDAFCEAWKAETIAYRDGSFGMWSSFAQSASRPSIAESLLRGLERGRRWLRSGVSEDGSVVGPAAVRSLADLVAAGLQQWQRDFLIHFGIRVGTRRLADASSILSELAMPSLSHAFNREAVLLGQLQYLLAEPGRDTQAIETLQHLADAHETMQALAEQTTS